MIRDFADGYRLGYATGNDIGYRRGIEDEGQAWTSVFAGCAEVWRQPRLTEVSAARKVDHQPCPTKCGACSRCIHSQAWYARGRRPYLGVNREAAQLAAPSHNSTVPSRSSRSCSNRDLERRVS